ncbi:sterol desaturase family protein [Povalibacter sp.]|uniref:sterol desaturase family protein n=1 Tax=Povalibacter sp. TaxID=1962978 RepID=UPI002F3F4118
MLPMNEVPPTQTSALASSRGIVDSLRHMFRVIAASRVNYWLAYATDFACAAAFGYLGMRAGGAWYVAFAGLSSGAFAFSFVEYVLHRWAFHSGSLLSGELHASHHHHPRQPSALPFWSSAVSAPAFFWLLTQFMSAHVAHFALCGFFAAYLSYGVLHHLQHSIRIKDIPFRWLRRKWAAHAVHHGRADVNFGVMTSLWDRVFGTYRAVAQR